MPSGCPWSGPTEVAQLLDLDAEALVQLLSLKFGPLPPAALEVVHAATSDQLATWTGRLLGAATLDEVLSASRT